MNNGYANLKLSNEDLFQIAELRDGIEQPIINLSGCSLIGEKIPELDMTNCPIRGIDLDGCSFMVEGQRLTVRNTDMSRSKIRGAVLPFLQAQYTVLTKTDFSFSLLSHINLRGARGRDTAFTSAGLDYAILSDTILAKADFEGANLSNVNIDKSCLSKAILKQCGLTSTKISSSDIIEGDWSGSKGVALGFSNSNLGKGVFCKVRWLTGTMESCDFTDSDFSGAFLSDIDFTNSNLSGCNFEGATFEGCIVDQANFKEANINGCTFKNTDASSGNLSAAIGVPIIENLDTAH